VRSKGRTTSKNKKHPAAKSEREGRMADRKDKRPFWSPPREIQIFGRAPTTKEGFTALQQVSEYLVLTALLYQDSAYLKLQMQNYRDGLRGASGLLGTPPMAMATSAHGFDDETIDKIVRYITSLRPERPPVVNHSRTEADSLTDGKNYSFNGINNFGSAL